MLILLFYRNHGKRNSRLKSMSKDLQVAVFDGESKFSGNIDDESDTETESSDSDAEIGQDRRNQLQLPKNVRVNLDESSDFIQFQRTTDDAVDGANISTMESIGHDKRLWKPNGKRRNNNCLKGTLDFDETQPHLKLKWATLYIQMSFRPLTLRAWLDERNKHTDFSKFYQKFIEKSVQQWEKIDVKDDDADENDDASNQNGRSSAGAVAKFNGRIHRGLSSSQSSSTLEHNLAKQWDANDVTLNIFIQALSGLRYIHLQNIVHHDVKPSNIFIGCEKTGELYIQLGDFGLACPLKQKHSPDSMIGTITYAAPEQLKGSCDPKVIVMRLFMIYFC